MCSKFARWLGAGLALVLAVGCGDDDGGGAPQSGDFLALSYNVAGLPDVLSGSNPEVNTAIIGPLLNGYDLVLLQESWRTPDVIPEPFMSLRTYHEILEAASEHPFRSEPLPPPFNSDPERPSAIISDGLNRFSVFPFGEVTRQRWFGCDDSAADCLSLKGFSVAETELAPGVCVDVYNLHGEAGNTPNDRDLKDMNTEDLLAFMEAYSGDRAIVMGGDFNMRLARERDAVNLTRLVDEGGLSDACIFQGIVDEQEIDKFFFRSSDALSIEPMTCRFETDVFIRPADGEPLSDHDALAVRFEWQQLGGGRSDCRGS